MRRRKTTIFFLVLGICLSALAVALNVGWVLLSLREVALLVLGIIFFALIITGLILNTIFLVREISLSEQHNAFLNSVTHELKTPIASIRLYLETLRSREVSPEERAEFYSIMLADSDRLLRTVDQILQASRTQETKWKDYTAEIDLNEVIEQAVNTVRLRYNLEKNAIRVTGSGEKPVVRGNAEDLQTAFVNLLDNAVKYSPGEKRISVRVTNSSMGNDVNVVITDKGVGIPQHELKRIFKRFYRAGGSAAKTAKGTGLGLYLVRSIIGRHGGKVRAESRGEGQGSTFLVRLPRL